MLDQAVAKVEDLIKNGNVPDLNVVDRRTREREMEREDRENERDRRGGARGVSIRSIGKENRDEKRPDTRGITE